MASRIWIGPWVEKLEYITQKTIIALSVRFKVVRDCFKNVLTKQLASQLQLMSLNEYNQKKIIREDAEARKKQLFEF